MAADVARDILDTYKRRHNFLTAYTQSLSGESREGQKIYTINETLRELSERHQIDKPVIASLIIDNKAMMARSTD